tara:strand:- start:3 stop:596 length:594 start_codon:yes stop_codon:yes gene_type:complete
MNLLEQRQIYLYNFLNRLYQNIGQTRPNIIGETEYYIQSHFNQHVVNPSQIEIREMQQKFMDIFEKYTILFSNRKIHVNQCFQKIINNYEYIPSLSSYNQSLFELNKLYNCISVFNNIKQEKDILEIPIINNIVIERPKDLYYNPYKLNYNWNMLSENFSDRPNTSPNTSCPKLLIGNNLIIIIVIIILIIYINKSK